MSHVCDETYDVYYETPRKARTAKPCSACERMIARGAIYMRVSWVFDGIARSVNRCGACQRTHEHLRKLDPGELWPDERLNCGLAYESEWGGAPPDEIAACAFATPAEASAMLAERHKAETSRRAELRAFRRRIEGARESGR